MASMTLLQLASACAPGSRRLVCEPPYGLGDRPREERDAQRFWGSATTHSRASWATLPPIARLGASSSRDEALVDRLRAHDRLAAIEQPVSTA